MSANSPRNRGTQPAWKTGASSPAPRGPQYQWKKEDVAAPGTGGRRLKQGLLFTGTLACLAGIVWLILYLWPTPHPCLVAISADPAQDADKLDVPLDLYGWQTANEFLKLGQERAGRTTRWVGRAPMPPTESGGGPLALPASEADLPEWVNRLKSYDPIILYVGLHGGTDGSGQPFLFVGGRNRLPVATLLTTLASDSLKSRRKVLILDCGRLAPDPIYGQIHDDFAARLKEMSAAVQACPNLVVMCGVSDGQRGWESEELRATSFGHAVLRCLRGEIDTGGNKIITARSLFESARQKTREWAQKNRPAAQDPFLLPDGDEGLNRAAAIDLGPRPNLPPSGSTPTAVPLNPALAQLWAEHDRLAGQVPRPAAFAPRAWRRYRELLLRYEQAARLGDQATTGKLATALTTARGEIERAAVGKLESARGSIALWAAVNTGGVVLTESDLASFPQDEGRQFGFAERALRQFASSGDKLPDRLARLAALSKKFEPPDRRPAEIHLPVMAEDFYATVLGQTPPTPPAGWAAAIETRSIAERAAAGLPIPATNAGERTQSGPRMAVYPERVWPLIRPIIQTGDAKRRKAEDRLFASNPKTQEQATELLQAARKDYESAATIAQAARTAFDVRDMVLADLPYLSRWYAERYSSTKDAAELIDLWGRTHALALKIDELTEKPDVEQIQATAKTAAAIGERYAQFLAGFQTEADRALNDAALQSEWWAKQQLLTIPLIPAEKRSAVLAASRHASGRLLTEQAQEPRASADATKTDERKATEVRGRLARAMLGDRLLDTQQEADKTLPRADILDHDLTTIATTADQWTSHAAQIGTGLAGHLVRLSASRLNPTATPDPRAERASRCAIPVEDSSDWEPAAANDRLRWRTYLTDLAERTADDHWYDEKPTQVPYYKAVASRFLADADRMTASLRSRTPPGTTGTWDATPSATLTAKLNAAPLTTHDLPPITWTSELSRTITFALNPLPAGYPVTGEAVAVGRFGTAAPIHAVDAALTRPLLPVPGGPLGLPAELRLDVSAEEITKPDGQASWTVYFRGQRPTQHVQIDLRRKPELVIADPSPDPSIRGQSVAVRADRNLQLGSVVILLDYSGSMIGDLNGVRLRDNNWKTGPSRFNNAMTALERVLGELPEKTPLRIRVFSGKRPTSGSEIVFGNGKGDDKPAVNWTGPDDPRLTKLIGKLRDIEPDGETPLVRSMIDVAEADFTNLPDASRTLLVVTDGAENDPSEPRRPGETDVQYAARRGQVLAEGFKGRGISVHVAQFALGNEKAASDKLFESIKNQQHDLVWLWPVNTGKDLQQALLDAIQPKLKLADRHGQRPDGFPRTGWVSRIADRMDPPYVASKLWWSPRLADDAEGPFKASAFPARVPNPVDLDLRPGELMILNFSNDNGGSRIRIRRELYADYIANPRSKTRRGDELWSLAVPGSAIDDQVSPPEFLSLAYLEQVPSYRRGKGSRDADVGPLSFAHPDLTWWQVTPALSKQEAPIPTGTVRVTRHYGDPAPGWDIKVENWPARPLRPAEFRVWAADTADTERTATFELCRPGDARNLTTRVGDKLEMRAAVEKWQPVGSPAPVDCLVVRFTFDKGKPILARPVDTTATYSEHRYYGSSIGADGMIAYTAVFQLPVERLKASGVRLKLIPVQPARTDDNLLTLTPPDLRRGKTFDRDTPPQPDTSVK